MMNSAVRQTVTTTTRTSNSDNNLDALLEDLQSTVSRSNSLRLTNGGGGEERRRVIREERTGAEYRTYDTEYHQPGRTEYQHRVEYLKPANPTTHITELHSPSEINNLSYGSGGQNVSSYKEYSYSTSSKTKPALHIDMDERKKHNINQLDNLLDDLNRSQNTHNEYSIVNSSSSGVDSGLLERSSRERRSGRGDGARRELVFTGVTGGRRSPSPARPLPSPGTQQVYRYEKTTTTTKTMGDGPGETSRWTVDSSSTRPGPVLDRGPTPPAIEHHTGYGKTSQSYNYSSSSNTRSRVDNDGRSPRRSPSPLAYHVSPQQASYSYSSTTTTRSADHSPYRTGDMRDDWRNTGPRPFPTPSPTPDQQPPKRLDDLMASFSSANQSHSTQSQEYRTTSREERWDSRDGRDHTGVGQVVPSPPAPPPATAPAEKQKQENITGPPVYYPKGELFATKEESSYQAKSGGGGKYKAKAKYEYEAGSKYKESSDTKVVPVCVPCPCCCAAPCSIM